VWATIIGYPAIEHVDEPLLVITIGVPTFPAAASVKPGRSERTVDEHVGTTAAPAFDEPAVKPRGEHERTTAPDSAVNFLIPLAKGLNSNLSEPRSNGYSSVAMCE
jgi:hypothetical protein